MQSWVACDYNKAVEVVLLNSVLNTALSLFGAGETVVFGYDDAFKLTGVFKESINIHAASNIFAAVTDEHANAFFFF
jgi:hypothetical protein